MTSKSIETELATMAVKHKINNAIENSPLADIEIGRSGDDEDEETKKKKEAERTLWTRIWQGSAVACVIVNLVSLAINKQLTILAGLFACVVGGAVFYYQFQIEDVDSLRYFQNKLRHQVNDFSQVNVSLSNNVTNLETESTRLKETQSKLEEIATESGITVDKLKNLVKENGIIIEEKKQLLQSDVVQSMIQVIFESDRDESADLNDREINRLILRMKNLPTINVNEDLLRLKVQANRSVRRIVSLVQTLDDKDIPKEDRVFVVKDDEES